MGDGGVSPAEDIFCVKFRALNSAQVLRSEAVMGWGFYPAVCRLPSPR